jgi:hypothetical protein
LRHGAVAAAVALGLAACSGGGDDGGSARPDAPDPQAMTGDWDVSLAIGTISADGDIPQALLPDEDFNYMEHWAFDDCDAHGCTLHRPEGGVLLGDLDDVTLTLDEDEGDLTATVDAAAPVDAAESGPCEGVDTDRWTITLRVSVARGVLTGSVLRHATQRRLEAADGSTCFGIGLSMGFSGLARDPADEGDGGD